MGVWGDILFARCRDGAEGAESGGLPGSGGRQPTTDMYAFRREFRGNVCDCGIFRPRIFAVATVFASNGIAAQRPLGRLRHLPFETGIGAMTVRR